MTDDDFTKNVVELYKKTAINVSHNLVNIFKKPINNNSNLSKYILNNITDNINIAKLSNTPVCQDTGVPIFYIKINKTHSMNEIKSKIKDATVIATSKKYLRPNAVDSITQINSNDNTGEEFPVIYFEEHNEDFIKIELLLKGGGCENIGRTYNLPNTDLNAERNFEGIKKCVIDSVVEAQGKGCPPYIISIAIGGSKDVVSRESKKGLLRDIEDRNSNIILNEFENELKKDINKLSIGPMGLGGNLTTIAVKIKSTHRHPASFFVDVCFSCWALRRGTMQWK